MGQDGCWVVGLQAAVVDCRCTVGDDGDDHGRALGVAEQEVVVGEWLPVGFALVMPGTCPQGAERAGEAPYSCGFCSLCGFATVGRAHLADTDRYRVIRNDTVLLPEPSEAGRFARVIAARSS